jgi:hypothetical protein
MSVTHSDKVSSGITILEKMPSAASSTANVRLKPCRAALLVTFALSFGLPLRRKPYSNRKNDFEYRSWNIENESYILAGDRQTTARQQCRLPDKADDGQKSWNQFR